MWKLFNKGIITCKGTRTPCQRNRVEPRYSPIAPSPTPDGKSPVLLFPASKTNRSPKAENVCQLYASKVFNCWRCSKWTTSPDAELAVRDIVRKSNVILPKSPLLRMTLALTMPWDSSTSIELLSEELDTIWNSPYGESFSVIVSCALYGDVSLPFPWEKIH